MGTRSEAGPVLILVAGLFLYQWFTGPSQTGNELCIEYGQALAAMWSEASDRIDRGDIRSEADLLKFANSAAESARKDIFSANLEPRFEAVRDESDGKWDAGKYANLCDRLASEFGE